MENINTYVITVFNKDKEKHVLAYSESEMFEILQNANNEKLEYVVNKAKLEQVLSNKTDK